MRDNSEAINWTKADFQRRVAEVHANWLRWRVKMKTNNIWTGPLSEDEAVQQLIRTVKDADKKLEKVI